MDHPVESSAAGEQPQAPAALIVRPSMALARRVGERVQRWILPLPLARIRGGLRQWRDALLRNPLAEELERTRRDNEQLQALLEELPEIFERKYQQRLEPLLEHQYRLLEDNALLMDQLRLLQSGADDGAVPRLLSAEARDGATQGPDPGAVAPLEGEADAPLPDPTVAAGEDWADQAAVLPEAIAETSVHLEGLAPAVADVTSLLISPPWGVPSPVVLESMHPSAPEPASAPDPAPQADANAPLVSPAAEPSFQELVSMASQQLQGEHAAETPSTPETAAASPWLAAPEPVGPTSALASEAIPFAFDPPVDQSPPATAEPLSPEPMGSGESQELDPLERARARRLQAWRRARQQGGA